LRFNPRRGGRSVTITGESANPWGTVKGASQTREGGDGEAYAAEINDKKGRSRCVGSKSSLAGLASPTTWVHVVRSGLAHGFADSPVAALRHPFGIRPQKTDAHPGLTPGMYSRSRIRSEHDNDLILTYQIKAARGGQPSRYAVTMHMGLCRKEPSGHSIYSVTSGLAGQSIERPENKTPRESYLQSDYPEGIFWIKVLLSSGHFMLGRDLLTK